MKEKPVTTSPRLSVAASCSIAILALIFVLRCYSTYHIFNDTKDEAVHISSGLEVWDNGRYAVDVQHPPLARLAIGLFARLAGLRYANPGALWSTGSVDSYWRTLSAARLGNLIFVPLLLSYIYLWGRRLYGPGPGLAGAILASLSPNLLAHASLATVDFGAATTGFLSAYHFWRWSREPGLGNSLRAALAFGLAALTKFSALVFVPALGVLFFLLARWDRRPRPDSPRRHTALQHGALLGMVFLLVVWGGYRFEVGPLPPAVFFAPPGTLAHRAVSAAEKLAGHRRLPAPGLLRGVLQVVAKNAAGHPCYLLGHLSQSGWWYYFPLTVALKTTLPFLLLVALGLGLRAMRPGREETRPMRDPLLAAAAVLLISMTSTLDLGIRYILLLYPLLALVGAGVFSAGLAVRPPARLPLLGLAAALGVWHAAESITAHPDYLAYFNQIARGREEQFLLDSNLDWGQDLERLRRYLDRNGISTVYLSYFGHSDPARLGISGVRPLLHDPVSDGWVAISKNHLGGIDRHPSDFAWLKKYAPAARIGKSILVYHASSF